MEKLVSSCSVVQALPEKFILPPDKRPGELVFPPCNTFPVIDLAGAEGRDRSCIIERVLDACQDFGLFQVINHGVSENLMDSTMDLFNEFFNLPAEDSKDPSQMCVCLDLQTSADNNNDNGEIHFWRDHLRQRCYPLEERMQWWPEKPTRYRDVVGAYSVAVRKLSLRILQLISEGLGLESGYFEGELTNEQLLVVNRYPPCPDPSLTLGLPKHGDPYLLTVLQQGGVYGLQVFKDGQWIGVEPIPNALVVNVGYSLQVISNGKLKCPEHRAVTNSDTGRKTIVTFVHPCFDGIVGPAEALISEGSPPLYRAFQFKDFLANYGAKFGGTETGLEPYMLQVEKRPEPSHKNAS